MRAKLGGASAVVAIAALLSTGTGAAFAASGYGPTAPTGPVDAPGGYTTVVETQTVTGSATTINSGSTGGASDVSLAVPQGAFSSPVQIEITAPDLSQVGSSLGSVGFENYTAVGGIGVKALDTNGQALEGTFAKPLSLVLTGPKFGVPGEKVIEFTGASSVTVLPATLGKNSITIELSADPDIAIVNPPAAAASGTVPGATTATTGKPFFGEELLASIAIALGLGGLLFTVRRRRRMTRA